MKWLAQKSTGPNGLHSYRLGDPKRPSIVCVHGFPDSWHSFRSLGAAIYRRGYCIYALSLPGYETTPSTSRVPIDLLDVSDRLTEFCDRLEHPKPVVIGHDWGALICQLAAVRAPQQLRGLVSLSLPPACAIKPRLSLIWKLRHFLWFRLPWLPQRRLYKAPKATATKLYRRWSPGWSVPDDYAEGFAAAIASVKDAQTIIDYYRAVMRAPWTRGARALRKYLRRPPGVATLTIGGTQEAIIDKTVRTRIDRKLGELGTTHTVDAGHFLHHERPHEVSALIANWLDQRY